MNGLKELAEQAGMHYRQFEDEFCKADTDGVPMEMLEAFAKLVAAKEREACAQELRGYAKGHYKLMAAKMSDMDYAIVYTLETHAHLLETRFWENHQSWALK